MKKKILLGAMIALAIVFSGQLGSGLFLGVKTAFGYGGGGGGGTYFSPTVTAIGVPLTLSTGQDGSLVQNLGNGLVSKLVVAPGSISGNTTFSISTGGEAGALNSTVFNISATDVSGNQVHTFSNNLNITLSGLNLPADVSNLGVYYFNETTFSWVSVPGASFDSATGSVTFSVNHLTKFAILDKTVAAAKNIVKPVQQVLGVTTYNEGTLLRASDKKIYIVKNGKLQHITTLAELRKYAGQEILKVSDSVISSYGKTVLGAKTFANGSLIRGADKKIYVIINGKKVHIINLLELRKHAGKAINDVSASILSQY